MNNHTALVNSLRLELSARGYLTILNVTGMFYRRDGSGLIPVKVGQKGSSDILACSPSGQFVAVEAKTGTGRLSPEQRAWRNAVEARGGIFIEAHSVADLAGLL